MTSIPEIRLLPSGKKHYVDLTEVVCAMCNRTFIDPTFLSSYVLKEYDAGVVICKTCFTLAKTARAYYERFQSLLSAGSIDDSKKAYWGRG